MNNKNNNFNFMSSIVNTINDITKDEQFLNDFKKLYNEFLSFDNNIQSEVNKEAAKDYINKLVDKITDKADKVADEILKNYDEQDEPKTKVDISGAPATKIPTYESFADKVKQKNKDMYYVEPMRYIIQALYDELMQWYNDEEVADTLFNISCRCSEPEIVITAKLSDTEFVSKLLTIINSNSLFTEFKNMFDDAFCNEHMGFNSFSIKPINSYIEFKLIG